jgi:hypothetical protein
MNAGAQPVIGMAETFNASGTHVLDIPCPRSRTTATVHLAMVDEQVRPLPRVLDQAQLALDACLCIFFQECVKSTMSHSVTIGCCDQHLSYQCFWRLVAFIVSLTAQCAVGS